MNNNSNIVLITRPFKAGDPLQYTYQWGEHVIKLVNDMGLDYIDLRAEKATYENLNTYMEEYRPRLYIHLGHACINNLQGQQECILTDGMNGLDDDNCNSCSNDSNVHTMDGTIVLSVACYSSRNLGRFAQANGCDCFVGYRDVLLFPVDSVGSQNMFRDSHIQFLRYLLSGHTVAEAERKMKEYEDIVISKNVDVKYLARPMLWDQLNREIIGDSSARLWRKY